MKQRVTNANKILSLKNQVDDIIAEVDDINNDIWNDINPLNVTLKDKSNVELLISRYNKLSEQDKTHIKNYDDVIYAQKVIAGLDKGNVVSDVFENIMGNSDADYKIVGKTSDDNDYTITFNGKDITAPSDFNTKIALTSNNKAKIDALADNALIISFSHTGNLPGKATVEIKVDLADGNYSLYYFNEQTQKAEFMQNVTVKNGMVSFEITHCSDYFIAKELKLSQQDNPKTGHENAIPVSFILIISCAALVLVTVSKRKTRASV